MCLTIPRKVIKIQKTQAIVTDGKKNYPVKINLVKGLKKGDWVLVQADLVVLKLKKFEANEINAILNKKAVAKLKLGARSEKWEGC